MKCPFCGDENIQGADTCESCGEDLTAFDGVRPKDSLEKSLVKDTIGSIAKCEPMTVSKEASIKEVASGLDRENTCCLVMDGSKLIGVVTMRDYLQKVMLKEIDIDKTPITEIMTPYPEILRPEDKIAIALNKMAIGGYRHVPIDLGNNQFGVVSVRDVLAYLAEMFPEAVRKQP